MRSSQSVQREGPSPKFAPITAPAPSGDTKFTRLSSAALHWYLRIRPRWSNVIGHQVAAQRGCPVTFLIGDRLVLPPVWDAETKQAWAISRQGLAASL